MPNAGPENEIHYCMLLPSCMKQASLFAVGTVVTASCANSTARQSLPALVLNRQNASQNRLTVEL